MYGNITYCLSSVRVAFAEDADMEAIRSAMIAQYGDPVPLDNAEYDDTFKQHVSRWESETTTADFMTDAQLENFRAQLSEAVGRPTEPNPDDLDTMLCWVYWSNDASYIFNRDPTTYSGSTNCLVLQQRRLHSAEILLT